MLSDSTQGDGASALALAGVAGVLVVAYAWRVATTAFPAPGPAIIESGLQLAGPAGLSYAAYRLATDDAWGAGGWMVVRRTLLGAAGVAAVAGLLLASRALQGDPITDGFLILHVAVGVGAVGGIAVGFHEVETRRYVDRLEHREETFVFLNNTLRHNVLNSVQVIQGHADQLGGDVGETVTEHCERVSELVQNVGVLSTTLAEDPDTGPTNLSAVLATEVRMARQNWPTAEIVADFPAQTWVVADRFLETVCENLVRNAIEHNDKETPRVEVTVESDDDAVHLRVADNGPGLTDEERRQAFDRGTRGDEGVGLYVVGTLIERYGGTVKVADNDPEGAVFTATFPVPEE
jgi:signal transduction histidine kinase